MLLVHRSVADLSKIDVDSERCVARGTTSRGSGKGVDAGTDRAALAARSFLLLAVAAVCCAAPAAAQSKDSVARVDSMPRRADTTHAPIRLCAGGDVTLGTNLDTVWAKAAARNLRTAFGMSSAPDELIAPL